MSLFKTIEKDPDGKWEIIDEGGNPMLHAYIDDIRYGFSLQSVNESKRVWMAQRISEQFQEIHDLAVKKTLKAQQEALRALAGL